MQLSTSGTTNIQSPNYPTNHHLADFQRKIIVDEIRDFENSLDDEHEVALKLASFGQSITLSVVSIGYQNPDILIFHGYVGEESATLIQHISQLSFLLSSAKKRVPNEPPRRIGFKLPAEETNSQNSSVEQ